MVHNPLALDFCMRKFVVTSYFIGGLLSKIIAWRLYIGVQNVKSLFDEKFELLPTDELLPTYDSF